MTTRKDILIKMYIDFLNEINDEEITTLFPKLDEMDIEDVVIFLQYFDDETKIKDTINDLLIFFGKEQYINKVDVVLPTIEKFIKSYNIFKKL
jgi:hypothetical protein